MSRPTVIPAQAGIQAKPTGQRSLDSGLRRNDVRGLANTGFYPTRRAFPGSRYYLVHDAEC